MKFDGLYMRNWPGASAEIWIATVGGNTCQVTGEALWGEGREFGPNMGDLNFAARLNNRTVIHSEISPGHSYGIALHFRRNKLKVVERNPHFRHGKNVTFRGTYRRVPERGLYPRGHSFSPKTYSTDEEKLEQERLAGTETPERSPISQIQPVTLDRQRQVPPDVPSFRIGLGEFVAALSIIYVCSIAAFNAGYFSKINGDFVRLFSFADVVGTNIPIIQYFFGAFTAYCSFSVLASILFAFGPSKLSVLRQKLKNSIERFAIKNHSNAILFWGAYIALISLVSLVQLLVSNLETSSFAMLILPQFIFSGALLYLFWTGYQAKMVRAKDLLIGAGIGLFVFSYESGRAWFYSETRSPDGVQAIISQDGYCLERKIIRVSGNGLLMFNPWLKTFEFRNRDFIKTIFEGKGCT